MDLDSLQLEIMNKLSISDGLSSDELYQESQLAEDRPAISKALSGLRNDGKVATRKTDEKRVFVITSEGLHWLSGGGKKTKNKKPDVERTKTGKSGVKFISSAGVEDFQCRLSPNGDLSYDFLEHKSGLHKEFTLTQKQVAAMWEKLAIIYPRIVHRK